MKTRRRETRRSLRCMSTIDNCSSVKTLTRCSYRLYITGNGRMAVDARNAQKDVYLEKPLADTIENCQSIAKAVRTNKRILQIRLQQRSMQH
jgi:hypothetical protein